MLKYAMIFIAALALSPLAMADYDDENAVRISDEPVVHEVVYTSVGTDCDCQTYREYDRTQKPANAHYNWKRGGCGGCEVVEVKCEDDCGHEVSYERHHHRHRHHGRHHHHHHHD
jgi:hypothetical protein